MNKKIGILGNQVENYFGVSVKYMSFAQQFGDVIVLTPDEECRKDIDLLILTGGHDVNPMKYNKIPEYGISMTNPFFEYFDEYVLPKYIENKIPIFGICRGLQTINVHFNGTLIQNIFGHPTSNPEIRTELVHNVIDYNYNIFGVNSFHHQVIDKIGDGLRVICKYIEVKDDDIKSSFKIDKEKELDKLMENTHIEAIMHEELPIYAVQWHPEEIRDEFSINLVKNLLGVE